MKNNQLECEAHTVTVTVTVSLCVLFWLLPNAAAARSLTAVCDPKNRMEQRALLPDQITVIINGYSESRIPLIQSISATYSSSAVVSSVLVLWGNPATPVDTLTRLAQNLSLSSPTVSLLRQSSSTLNARFLPRPNIATRAVLICDDDVEVDQKSFEFAFAVWRSNPERLVGMFARSHDVDLISRKWIYTVHPDKYSIVLTKFMILKNDYLFDYSCGGPEMGEMRRIVDRMQNCEDILMNFVVSDVANAGPVLVGAERVRDWGDPRNDDGKNDGDGDGELRGEDREGNGVKEAGLSSRRGEHRKRRGECIRKFHKVMGRMPLRYSYGKVVDSVGEQGLCSKGGKLVYCDQYQ